MKATVSMAAAVQVLGVTVKTVASRGNCTQVFSLDSPHVSRGFLHAALGLSCHYVPSPRGYRLCPPGYGLSLRCSLGLHVNWGLLQPGAGLPYCTMGP